VNFYPFEHISCKPSGSMSCILQSAILPTVPSVKKLFARLRYRNPRPSHSLVFVRCQNGNLMFRSFVSSPWTFRPNTFRPLDVFNGTVRGRRMFPVYSVKTQAASFVCFNYSCHSVRVSCVMLNYTATYLLTYLLTYQGVKRLGGETSSGELICQNCCPSFYFVTP